MIISHEWLKQYIPHDLTPEALGERITFQACPVESIEAVDGGDAALELEVTFNRADLLSHIGVAAEVAAIVGGTITVPEVALEDAGRERADAVTSVTVEAADLCPRYTARVIRGVKIGPSPEWLVARLEAIGVRPVNNVVDVTNFVLHECGQPLHAFDFATLKGPRIVVRRGTPGETMTAIDGSQLELNEETLVIADAERPVAIAGIMGGLDTEISDGTTDVLLESAYFDPVATRRAVRRLNLRSDSSHRFERGVDPSSIEWASRRAAVLITEVAGGEVLDGIVDVDAETLPGPHRVTLRLARLERVAGFVIPSEEAEAILLGLGMGVEVGPEAFEVTVPTVRFEVAREIDLIEEVLRCYGYDKVPEATALPIAVAAIDRQETVTNRLRATLVGAGYREILSISFAAEHALSDPPLFSDRAPRTIRNPVRQETPALRRSLFGGLCEAKAVNLAKGTREVRLFETGTVYLPSGGTDAPEVSERLHLGVLADDDLFGVKGVLEEIAVTLGLSGTVKVIPVSNDTGLGGPARATDDAGVFEAPVVGHIVLNVDGSPVRIGWIGRLSAQAAKHHEIDGQPIVAVLDLEALLKGARLVPGFTPISPFPQMTRDLAVVVPSESVYVGAILGALSLLRDANPVLRTVDLLSVFEGDGKSLDAGLKSVAVRLTCQAADRTLTGEEADAVREAAKDALTAAFDATFRE